MKQLMTHRARMLVAAAAMTVALAPAARRKAPAAPTSGPSRTILSITWAARPVATSPRQR